jgi:hypothetical protein
MNHAVGQVTTKEIDTAYTIPAAKNFWGNMNKFGWPKSKMATIKDKQWNERNIFRIQYPFSAYHFHLMDAAVQKDQRSLAVPIIGGLIGGAAGLVAGGQIGYGIDSANCEGDEWFCGIGGIIIGGTIGESIGLPLGVHLGNGRKGNFGKELFSSLGIAAGGMVLAVVTGEGAVLLTVPPVQLAVSLSIERK